MCSLIRISAVWPTDSRCCLYINSASSTMKTMTLIRDITIKHFCFHTNPLHAYDVYIMYISCAFNKKCLNQNSGRSLDFLVWRYTINTKYEWHTWSYWFKSWSNSILRKLTHYKKDSCGNVGYYIVGVFARHDIDLHINVHRSNLQYFWPALSDNEFWNPIFGLLFECPLKTCFTVQYKDRQRLTQNETHISVVQEEFYDL